LTFSQKILYSKYIMRFTALLSFFIALFLLIATASIIPTTALAQTTQSSAISPQSSVPYNTPNFNPEVPRNQHTFTQSAMIEIASSVFCIITGIDPINPAQGCLDIDPKTHKLGLRPPQDGKPQIGGLMGFLPGMFSMVYTPPASGTDYFRYLAGNFGITKPAYAAGGGFEALRPLLPLWTAARNVAYLLFVVVFIVVGLAIMLRVKIDPRTVMTLQNQIPRIIVGILLVTFSYAIAGLMIDGMWLLTYAGINVITQSSTSSNPIAAGCTPGGTLQQRATQNLISTPFTFGSLVLQQPCPALAPTTEGIRQVTWNVGSAIGTIVFDLITKLFGYSISGLSCAVDIGCWISWIFGTVIGGIAGFLALIIIFLALMWAMFTLWFELLKAYVMLILYIIGAPLWIVTGLLPGNPLGFGKWMRRMFVHLAVFPAVVCLLVVAAVLMNIFNNAPAGSFVPPLIGQNNMAGFGSLLAFAVILMAPTLLEVLKENLHAASKGGQIAAGGVVRGISGGAAAPKGFAGGVWSKMNQRGVMGDASYFANLLAGDKPGSFRYKAAHWGLGTGKNEAGTGYRGTKAPKT
jgi:hypothetical protein